jgi:nucleoside 2-deoxyribosyltransferase
MDIYLAGPLFSQAERRYNRLLAKRLQELLPRASIVLPQDFRADPAETSFNDRRHSGTLYRRCVAELNKCDLVVALVDGADVDSGVAFEIGYMRGLGKPVLGVRTDYRQLQVKGLNVMLAEGCTEVLCYFSFNEKLDDLATKIVEHIERLPKDRPGPDQAESDGMN